MLTLFDLELAFPNRVERMEAVAAELHLSPEQARMYERFFGFETFQCDPALPLASMMHQAASCLLNRNESLDRRLTHVVHCHTLPTTTIFADNVRRVLEPFASRGLEVFSATMNHCATGLSVLQVLDGLLGDDDVALVLIGEKAFHRVIRVIENATIMGEAACALIIGRGPGPYEIVANSTLHDGRFAVISGAPGEGMLDDFGEHYVEFARNSIDRALSRFGVNITDIRCVMAHNVNIPSWGQIAKQIGVGIDRISIATISRFGHCFGADPYINLLHSRNTGAIGPGDLVLLFSIGLGATASSALVRVNGSPSLKAATILGAV